MAHELGAKHLLLGLRRLHLHDCHIRHPIGHVRTVGSHWRLIHQRQQQRATFAHFAQCTIQPSGIAGELNSRGIGQVFALACHRRLYHLRHDEAQGAHHHQYRAQRQVLGGSPLPHDLTGHTDQHKAGQCTQHPHIEAHVAIKDMAELVGHHRLQFIAGQSRQGATGERNDCRLGRPAGSKGIDSSVFKHIYTGYRAACCNRHFLNHLQAPAFVRVRAGQGQGASAHVAGQGRTIHNAPAQSST